MILTYNALLRASQPDGNFDAQDAKRYSSSAKESSKHLAIHTLLRLKDLRKLCDRGTRVGFSRLEERITRTQSGQSQPLL